MYNNENIYQAALLEDLGENFCDLTTDMLFQEQGLYARATILNKEKSAIVFCGEQVVEKLLSQFTPEAQVQYFARDGESVASGDIVLTIDAGAATLLKLERTLLNFLRQLSAIATYTAKFVAAAGKQLTILDTRKTTPGMRFLEKYAVRAGGGSNHRMGLYDAIMVKDTHVELLQGVESTLKMLPQLHTHHYPVIFEVRDLVECQAVLTHGKGKVSRILLDNMSLATIKKAVQLCQNQFEIEVSGNLDVNDIALLASAAVDYASVGCITHSAGNVDLSMKTALL